MKTISVVWLRELHCTDLIFVTSNGKMLTKADGGGAGKCKKTLNLADIICEVVNTEQPLTGLI